MSFRVVIPARYASSRLPGKPLAQVAGQPMIRHVYERARASAAEQVVIATDDERVAEVAEGFGAEVCMTSSRLRSGTDRLEAVVRELAWPEETIVVNLQGDEPLMPPAVIDQVAANLAADPGASVATLCEPIDSDEQFRDPNLVKVVADAAGRALYFSRAPIPWPREAYASGSGVMPARLGARRHIGLYAYRAGLLRRFVTWPESPLEHFESLEQLRVLWQGEAIHLAEVCQPVPGGVDTEADLARVRAALGDTGDGGDGSTER